MGFYPRRKPFIVEKRYYNKLKPLVNLSSLFRPVIRNNRHKAAINQRGNKKSNSVTMKQETSKNRKTNISIPWMRPRDVSDVMDTPREQLVGNVDI